MTLLDLAKRCEVTMQVIAKDIKRQFNETLIIGKSTYVPKEYVIYILDKYQKDESTNIMPKNQLTNKSARKVNNKTFNNENNIDIRYEGDYTSLSDKEKLEILKKAVNSKILKGIINNYNGDRGIYFVDVMGFKSLLYENEILENKALHPGALIDIVPLKVDGHDRVEYMAVSMKRAKELLPRPTKRQKESEFAKLEIGEKINVTVSDVRDKFIIVEFGSLTGKIYKRDLFWNNISKIDHFFKTGENLEVIVKSKEIKDSKFEIILSHKELTFNLWDALDTNEEENYEQVLKGSIVEIKDNVIDVALLEFGVEGFIPLSEMTHNEYRKFSKNKFVNQIIELKIKDFDTKKKFIVFTRKPFYDEVWDWAEDNYKNEDIYSGKIIYKTDKGVIVELQKNLEVFIPQRELSWEKTTFSNRDFLMGKDVKIKIIEIDFDRRIIKGTIRETIPDPWVVAQNKYKCGTNCKVIIKEYTSRGIIVELENDQLIGFIPWSEVSWFFKPDELPDSEKPPIGSEVECKIMVWQPEKRNLKLSIRQVLGNPWEGIFIGASIAGKIESKLLGNKGYLIRLESGIKALSFDEGLDEFLNTTLFFKIINFEKSKKEIILSHKQFILDKKSDGVVKNFFKSLIN